MTIEVIIKNNDVMGGKTVRVMNVYKGDPNAPKMDYDYPLDLRPGTSATFYLYEFKDLNVSEVTNS